MLLKYGGHHCLLGFKLLASILPTWLEGSTFLLHLFIWGVGGFAPITSCHPSYSFSTLVRFALPFHQACPGLPHLNKSFLPP